jgi:hypothetical protein
MKSLTGLILKWVATSIIVLAYYCVLQRYCWVTIPSILASKSGEGSLPYSKIGAKLDGNNQPDFFVSVLLMPLPADLAWSVSQMYTEHLFALWLSSLQRAWFVKFRYIIYQYSIGTVFKSKQTIYSPLVNIRSHRDILDVRHYVYSTPCKCGRNYVGKPRLFRPHLREYKHNLRQGLIYPNLLCMTKVTA